MKFFDRKDIAALAKFKNPKFLTASVYFSSDKSALSKKEIDLNLKNLMSDGRTRVDALNETKEKKDSLLQDIEKIRQFLRQNNNGRHSAGQAMFSCSAGNFWQAFNLPHGPRNRIVFNHNPYIRPLLAILDRFRRNCVFLVSRREARWFEICMGNISLLDSLTSDVPSKVREGGWEGYESKRIERHIEAHLHEHLKKAAQHTFSLFKKHQFDRLFLGCEDSFSADLESFLHSYLKERLKGRMKAKTGDSPDKVLREAEDLEAGLKKKEENELVARFVSEMERGGRAAAGARETLKHINQADVQTLLVTHNFSKEGRACPSCRFLYLEEAVCPSCQKKTEAVEDVIDEACEAAMKKNGQVKHVAPPSKLDRFGKIGAFLRY